MCHLAHMHGLITPPKHCAGGQPQQHGLSWFVQVSDTHLSRFAVEQMPKFGDKEGDFGYLASQVLRPMAPAALVLTGDLVDGKTKLLRGAQSESEWQVRGHACIGIPALVAS